MSAARRRGASRFARVSISETPLRGVRYRLAMAPAPCETKVATVRGPERLSDTSCFDAETEPVLLLTCGDRDGGRPPGNRLARDSKGFLAVEARSRAPSQEPGTTSGCRDGSRQRRST